MHPDFKCFFNYFFDRPKNNNCRLLVSKRKDLEFGLKSS